MTTPNKTCSVKILNKTYDIKCPEHEMANLHSAAQKLNEEIIKNKKKFKQLDDFQQLLLAALHISHELISCHQQQAHQRSQVTQFMSSLETKINAVVNSNPLFDPQTD